MCYNRTLLPGQQVKARVPNSTIFGFVKKKDLMAMLYWQLLINMCVVF